MFRNLIASIGLSALLVLGGCSAGTTGGGAAPAPVSDFSFSTPAESAQVTKGQNQSLKVVWTSNGNPVSNHTITFDTTGGLLTGDDNASGITAKATTLADGSATVQFVGDSNGPTTITASATDPDTNKALSAKVDVTVVGVPASLSASSPTPIDASGTSLVTATVKDANGTALSGIQVGFTLDNGGGSLSVRSILTDTNGIARSVFTPDGTSDSVIVNVTQDLLPTFPWTITVIPAGGLPPSKLTFTSCPTSIPSLGSVKCTINLVDGDGNALGTKAVDLSTVLGTFPLGGGGTQPSSTSVTTDASGNASFTYQAFTTTSTNLPTYPTTGISGAETITATVHGSDPAVTQTFDMKVTPATFAFISPADQSQVTSGISVPAKFKWISNGVAMTAQPVTLALTVTAQNNASGTAVLIDGSNASGQTLNEKTDSNGLISFDVLSNTFSSTAVLTASAVDTASGAQMTVGIGLGLVGSPASTIDNAASPIPVGGSSLITVQVKDSVGALLAGQTVHFAIESGNGKGSLNVLWSKTDSTGTASAIYTATGDNDGDVAKIDVSISPVPMQVCSIVIGSGTGTDPVCAPPAPAGN